MTVPAVGLQNPLFDSMESGFGYSRTNVLGLGTSFAAGGAWLAEATVGRETIILIDEVRITVRTLDAATNVKVTLKINGVEVPFNFPGIANARRSRTLVWKPKGNLVITSASVADAFNAKCSVASTAWISTRFRRIKKSKAMEMKLWGNGSIPLVASSNSFAGSGLTAATAKAIIAAVPGYHVKILGFVFTGGGMNAASDSHRLGFWDGTAGGGTFTTGGHMVFRAYSMGTNPLYAPEIVVNDTKGCIIGPVGYGLYVQASTNLAGNPTNSDYVVLYQLVKGNTNTYRGTLNATLSGAAVTSVVMAKAIPHNLPPVGTIVLNRADGTTTSIAYTSYTASTFTIASTDFSTNNAIGDVTCTFSDADVVDSTGRVGGNTYAKKWWVFHEGTTGLSAGTSQAFFGTFLASTSTAGIRIRGHAGSVTGTTADAASPALLTVGVGAEYSYPVADYQHLNSDGALTAISNSWVQDDMVIPLTTSQVPGFVGVDATSYLTARSQLAWGTMNGEVHTGITNVRDHLQA